MCVCDWPPLLFAGIDCMPSGHPGIRPIRPSSHPIMQFIFSVFRSQTQPTNQSTGHVDCFLSVFLSSASAPLPPKRMQEKKQAFLALVRRHRQTYRERERKRASESAKRTSRFSLNPRFSLSLSFLNSYLHLLFSHLAGQLFIFAVFCSR